MSNPLFFYKKMKNGKLRLYKCVQQAITAWRGSNDKISVVREDDFDFSPILNFATLIELQNYCKNRFNTSAFEMDVK